MQEATFLILQGSDASSNTGERNRTLTTPVSSAGGLPRRAWLREAGPGRRGHVVILRHAGSGDEHRDRDELACRGGADEGVKDLVIAEHRW